MLGQAGLEAWADSEDDALARHTAGVLSQAVLEAVAGQRHPDCTPAPAGMNTYLFSSLGQIGPCEIVTAGRSMIVFVSSGIALLAGLLLIYVRAARHPVILLAATAILAVLAAIYPELALMAAQASAIGLALVLLAAFLLQLIAGRRRPLLPELSSAVAPVVLLPRPSEPSAPASQPIERAAIPAAGTPRVPGAPGGGAATADPEYIVPAQATVVPAAPESGG